MTCPCGMDRQWIFLILWIFSLGFPVGAEDAVAAPVAPRASCSASLAVPQRIVSLMPSQTELIFALGAGDRVVGVSDHCSWPPQVASLPRVGAMELNLERLAMLNPDLVIDLNASHVRFHSQIARLGIPVRDYRIERLEEIPSAALLLSRDLGMCDRGEAFVADWCRQLDAVTPASPTRRVYLEVWGNPPQAAGGSSFIGDLLRRAGAVNVYETSGSLFPLTDSESIVKFDPEVIFLVYVQADPTTIGRRFGWSGLTAVRNRAVHPLDPDPFVRPGPRCVEAIRRLAEGLGTGR